MIRFQCDRCERELSFDEEQAGEKVECPYCGDVNRVPEATGEAIEPSPAPDSTDRAAAAGLPPDSGPEQPVLVIRPSIWRAFPLRSFGMAALPIILPVLLRALFGVEWTGAGWTFVVAAVVLWLPLGVWWLVATRGVMLTVTNKRVIERRGLFTRATSEVMHDHVRNIQIDQSFVNRILRVGHVGISSSGQDGIEIQMRNIPSPDRLKAIIDRYRPM